jgi:hypothetical protein
MKCLFSDEETSSEEHVLPRWMQKRFSLANQTYNLPNGTPIAYRNARVPAAQAHNTKFGEIEDRLSRGVAPLQEIYLWAFKIHVGLIHRSASLRIDIRSPSSPNFWKLEGFGQEIWLFQKLYAIWAAGGTIQPDPFGTVLRMKALTPQPSFDFIHNMQSGTVFFQLGDEVLFVALYDQARAMTSNIAKHFEYHRQVIAAAPADQQAEQAMIAQRVWACEFAYFLHRSATGMSFISTDSMFSVVPPLAWPPTRPSERPEYRSFYLSFGLKLEHFGGEVGHRYTNLKPEDVRDLQTGRSPPDDDGAVMRAVR